MRAVVFGLGRMGLRHVEVLKSSGLEILAAVDPSPDARKAAAERFDIESDRLVPDVESVRSVLGGADVAIVSTTAPSHAELTVLASEAGVPNILCEKPMATSIAEAQEMLSVCRRNGTRLAINHQMRFLPHYSWAKDCFDADTKLGDLSGITVTAGNFGLAMNASHYFELFRYTAGESVSSVQAWFDDTVLPNPRGPDFADRSGCIRATTESGKRLYIDFSADQGLGLRLTYAGRFGQLFMDELAGCYDLTYRKDEFRDRPTTLYALPSEHEQGAVEPTDALASSREMLNALLSGGDYPTGEDGLAVMRCLVACHLSADAGGAVIPVTQTAGAADRVFPWA
ncbi:Gfo/Idh/MocA family oxidoreductase [Rhodospirillaceae bacterium KN72]|uniref:Gfo/Idh/MocA family oxidoreductase n=1 Tax=Pacificispira spongiicola TaxID=2729598 RepID=A0A7Y0E1K6_9PROT|nr:Gfo/Idh/MocA family oxidoreductase [Pacificispira spongiicola]NMM45574.1 Gfo/Idh/MocA family oxidoreductase [Pacificispira spongiicola]